MSTPLHAALGRLDSALSFDLIEEACRQRMPETEEIDFKRDLPLPSRDSPAKEEIESRTLELAKDLAAMANGRGGMLIYGVRDEQNAAAEVVGVSMTDNGDKITKQIRQVAYNYVHPPLQVRATPLISDDSSKRVLVVEVAESEETPHLVRPKRDGGNQGWLLAPFRSGPDTNNMVEKQLESAYRQRFEGRRRREQSLRDMHTELIRRHVTAQHQQIGTVAAVAQPSRPAPWTIPGQGADRAAEAIRSRAAWLAQEIHQNLLRSELPFPLACFSESMTARRGPRRYVLTTPRATRNATTQGEGYIAIELHDDGSVGLVWRRGNPSSDETSIPPAPPTLGEADMDAVALMLTALLVTVREEGGPLSDYQARVSIVPESTIALLPERDSRSQEVTQVEASPAVEAELRLSSDPTTRARDILTFGLDLANAIGRTETVIDRFWDFGQVGRDPNNLLRRPAERLFGGLPPHPENGRRL